MTLNEEIVRINNLINPKKNIFESAPPEDYCSNIDATLDKILRGEFPEQKHVAYDTMDRIVDALEAGSWGTFGVGTDEKFIIGILSLIENLDELINITKNWEKNVSQLSKIRSGDAFTPEVIFSAYNFVANLFTDRTMYDMLQGEDEDYEIRNQFFPIWKKWIKDWCDEKEFLSNPDNNSLYDFQYNWEVKTEKLTEEEFLEIFQKYGTYATYKLIHNITITPDPNSSIESVSITSRHKGQGRFYSDLDLTNPDGSPKVWKNPNQKKGVPFVIIYNSYGNQVYPPFSEVLKIKLSNEKEFSQVLDNPNKYDIAKEELYRLKNTSLSNLKDKMYRYGFDIYTQDGDKRLQYIYFDGPGFENVLINFTNDGGFWVEWQGNKKQLHSGAQKKYNGSWWQDERDYKYHIKLDGIEYDGYNLKDVVTKIVEFYYGNNLENINTGDDYGTSGNMSF